MSSSASPPQILLLRLSSRSKRPSEVNLDVWLTSDSVGSLLETVMGLLHPGWPARNTVLKAMQLVLREYHTLHSFKNAENERYI